VDATGTVNSWRQPTAMSNDACGFFNRISGWCSHWNRKCEKVNLEDCPSIRELTEVSP
jgi:hypothetical protein